MIRSNSMLMFIFIPFIITINYSTCFWKKAKDSLEDYVIDVFFTNSLTIIRCNPYERHILRSITIETIGHIKCSNRNLFLPDNHIENITLLEWVYTSIKCDKAKTMITQHRTYIDIKHKAKKAFKKNPLSLIRVGSTGPSKLHWDESHLQMYFDHPQQKLSPINNNKSNQTFTKNIYSFQHRPILCRERKLTPQHPCSKTNQSENSSYVCYYRVNFLTYYFFLYEYECFFFNL